VIATSFVAGSYLVVNTITSFWFGSIVDHNKKKNVMLLSSFITMLIFSIGFVFYNLASKDTFTTIQSFNLWALLLLLLLGVIVGNLRNIALPTLTVLLVPKDLLDKANGMAGTVTGISFAITSVASGFALSLGGMFWVLLLGIIFTALSIIHLLFIKINEDKIEHTEDKPKEIDIRGTLATINAVPGLTALILFATINNLLGGVFMSLMDAYGLSLVSLKLWGVLWGLLSFGFIFSGLYISKKGLGKNPLRSLFMANIIIWTASIFFTIQPSIVLLMVGAFIWIASMPFIEAAEQTIFQTVVPVERLGRVFGFAHSVESAASPVTAFLIGPLTQYIFIPFMTTGAGVGLIGNWFGTGTGRGIALVFCIVGVIGLGVTIAGLRSKYYRLLSEASSTT
jgi:DHA3 family multidrug efflux protein-like MFS transporter